MSKNTFKLNLIIPIFFGLIFSFFLLNTVSALESVDLVKDMVPGSDSSYFYTSINVDGKLYFVVNGSELWVSDGTETGTKMLSFITAPIMSQMVINGTLYFSTYGNSTYGSELWKTDGTTAGTVLVKDINPGTSGSYPQYFANINGVLYFVADNGINGAELWKSDGTGAGTVLVKDINPGTVGSSPRGLINVNGNLYFIADDGSGYGLWKFDVVSADATMLFYIYNPSYFSRTDVNGILYFAPVANSEYGSELWKTDGTVAGTVLVKDINPGTASSSPTNLNNGLITNINGIIYFPANDGVHGNELWRSDGTEAGTILVKDINSGAGNSSPSKLINVNGVLYFIADNGVNGKELWRSDGTEVGTVMVKDIYIGSSNSIDSYDITNIDGILYFTANNGVNGKELWKSDGTEAGTVLVKDIYIGTSGSDLSGLINVNGILYFNANDGVHGRELWKLANYGKDQSYDSVGNLIGSSKAVLGVYENPGYRYKKYEDTLYRYLENFHQLTGLMLKKFSK